MQLQTLLQMPSWPLQAETRARLQNDDRAAAQRLFILMQMVVQISYYFNHTATPATLVSIFSRMSSIKFIVIFTTA